MGLAIALTVSRGGFITAIVATAFFVCLAPDRLPKLATIVIGAGGTVILVAGLAARLALRDGLSTALAHRQGDQLLAVLVVVCLGAAALQVAISLMATHATRPAWMAVSRRSAPRPRSPPPSS